MRLKNLYLMNTPGCDKTAVTVGLALQLRDEGARVGFFKPVGRPSPHGQADREAALMASLLDLDTPPEVMVPFVAGPSYLSGRCTVAQVKERVVAAYREVASRFDVVVISCPAAPHVAGSFGLDAVNLFPYFDAVALLVARVENDYSVDEAVYFHDCLAARHIPLAGVIFNSVPQALLAKTRGVYVPLLEERQVRGLGVLPARTVLTAPTVEEIHEQLDGEVLAGERNMHLRVEDLVVGAMTIESALNYLRRSPNKAVVTGGDRADLALAALETSTSAIILTGGLYPDVKVIARAEDKGVPLILVHADTYTTVERLNGIVHHVRAADHEAVAAARESIAAHCRWLDILERLREE